MSEEERQRLRTEVAQLDQAIASLAGMPALQAPLLQQRAERAATLARLEGGASAGQISVDLSGQSGGISMGAFTSYQGPVQIGHTTSGPVINGGIWSGRDTYVAGGEQTIIHAAGTASPEPAPIVPPRPRARIADATLSVDGVHFSYGHALVIGVGRYRDRAIPTVVTTANDARAIGAVLCDQHLAAYPSDQVCVLTDAEATRAAILDALEALAQRAAGATALICFAGHGELLGDDYVLLPFDTDTRRLGETTLTSARFHDAVAKVRARAKRLIVLLNCCHAGGVGAALLHTASSDTLLQGSAPPAAFYRPLAVGSGQVVISSSRPEQKSGAVAQRNAHHTPFGAVLLDALRGAAPGDGPAVGVFELFAALRTHVPIDASHIRYQGGPLRQEPLFYAHQLDDNLPVALRPGWQGGTLSGAILNQVRRLVEQELQSERSITGHPGSANTELDARL